MKQKQPFVGVCERDQSRANAQRRMRMFRRDRWRRNHREIVTRDARWWS